VGSKEVQEGRCIVVFAVVNFEQVFDAPGVHVDFKAQASGNSKCNCSKANFFQGCLDSVILWVFAQQVKFHIVQGVVCYHFVQGAHEGYVETSWLC